MQNTQPTTTLPYTVYKDDDAYDGVEGFALAEFLVDDVMEKSSGLDRQPVYTIRNQAGDVLSSFTHGRIIGTFQKEQWDARDNAIDCGSEDFDATAHVLAMTHADLMALQDRRETTDYVGQAHVKWDGPHQVVIVDRICAHFGVEELDLITASHLDSVRQRWVQANPPAPQPEPAPELVTPRLIGEFVDGVSDRAGVARRTPKAVAGRLLEEVVELALAAGVAPGKIFEHVTDSLHNQALKASRKTDKTVFPSQLQEVEGDEEGIPGECADVSMVFKDFCWVAKVEGLDKIEAEKNQRFTRLGDYNVAPNGCIYRHKPHVKTSTEPKK